MEAGPSMTAGLESMPLLGGTGVFAAELRFAEHAEIVDSAAELESLGYTALWIPDVGGPVFEALDLLLGATSAVTVATAVLNIWRHAAGDVAGWWEKLPEDHRRRVMLGLGVSHAQMIGAEWRRPLAVMREFLDSLDANGPPPHHRCLGALGPKMLELARRRTSGAIPYLVTPEHTHAARKALGDGGRLYVEQGIVFETDPAVAREIARAGIDIYCGLPNYVNNWKRLGFTDDDVASRSDRLVDGLIAWGDADAIRDRLDAHRKAGADHVCIQVIHRPGASSREAWRALAP